jgi:hypothetical protein
VPGAYCKFCDFRCFVYRVVPDGPRKGWAGHMATCRRGMELDLKMLDHTHLTAINPITEPEAAEALCAWSAGEHGRRAAGLAVEAGEYARFAAQVGMMFPDPARAPGADRMTGGDWLHVVIGALRDHGDAYPLVRSYWNRAAQVNG